jgi:hypothetical protein
MTLTRLTEPEADPDTILGQAEAHYLDILHELQRARRDIAERGDMGEAEIKRVLAEYRRITTIVFEERKRIEDVRKRSLGIVHDYALHLDLVRGEIGRRLDRLRAAVGEDGAD